MLLGSSTTLEVKICDKNRYFGNVFQCSSLHKKGVINISEARAEVEVVIKVTRRILNSRMPVHTSSNQQIQNTNLHPVSPRRICTNFPWPIVQTCCRHRHLVSLVPHLIRPANDLLQSAYLSTPDVASAADDDNNNDDHFFSKQQQFFSAPVHRWTG